MNEETCTGKCHDCGGCNGCSEKVTLSCNPDISFVSTITFSARRFEGYDAIRLVIECAKDDVSGECYAGIGYYKNGKELTCEPKKHKIDNTELLCLNLDFDAKVDADKAEIKVYCKNGATLRIEHINVINVRKA